jgi:penicillin amidase
MMEYFANWHFRFTLDDIATSIFNDILVHLVRNIYADELGEDLFHDFVLLVNVPLRVTLHLMTEETSPWFDDVRTEHIEFRDDILRRSVWQALDDLMQRRGSDTKAWRWGDIHTVTLQHPFGLQPPLDKIFNLGPHPCAGASTALISGEYNFNAPFAVTIGPSFRMIVDTRNPSEYRAILPSGQSGQVFHPHYDDQLHLWLNGSYRNARTTGVGSSHETLTLQPVQ